MVYFFSFRKKEGFFPVPEKPLFLRGMAEMFRLALLGILVGGGVSFFVGLLGAGEIRVAEVPRIRMLLLPGALLFCTLLEERFFPGIAGHGMESLRRLSDNNKAFPPFAWLLKMVRTLVTLISGGSGGIVGPSAYMGGALFSAASSEKAFSRENLFCGAAGGVAAILGTPFGAALFVMESLGEKPLYRSFSLERFCRCFWCSFWSWKCTLWFSLVPHPHLNQFSPIPEKAPLFLLLCLGGGVFFGVLAVCHVLLLRHARRGMRLFWKNPYLRALAGAGLILSLHFLSEGHVCGTGQEDLGLYFHGQEGDALLRGFWKSLATGITVGAGGSAGMVGPTFFVGAMGGIFFAHLTGFPADLFALFGAAAVLGGAANTPVACTIFLVEICGFSALLPAMLLCGVAYLVGRRWNLFYREDTE